MTQEDKQLLIKDLCARLPYGVKVKTPYNDAILIGIIKRKSVKKDEYYIDAITDKQTYPIRYIQPYLRPMSSMTEEEFVYFMGLRGRMLQSYEIQSMMKEALNMPQFIKIGTTLGSYSNKIDWLNARHFDYRGLIEKGLALVL